MKQRWVKASIFFVIVVVGLAGLWLSMPVQKTKLSLNNHSFQTTILRTDEERIRGLSGTKSLPSNKAMLFVFPYDATWTIWMKDMHFSIDIIWVNNSNKVVHMVKDAQPSSYPDTIFKPNGDARYVIETISGTIEETGIKKGDTVTLPSGV